VVSWTCLPLGLAGLARQASTPMASGLASLSGLSCVPEERAMRFLYLIITAVLLTALGLLGFASTHADTRSVYSMMR
jgi:hypothetical protein